MIAIIVAFLINGIKKIAEGIGHILGDEYFPHVMEKPSNKILSIYLQIQVLGNHLCAYANRKAVLPQLFRKLGPFSVKHLDHGHAQGNILNLFKSENYHRMRYCGDLLYKSVVCRICHG